LHFHGLSLSISVQQVDRYFFDIFLSWIFCVQVINKRAEKMSDSEGGICAIFEVCTKDQFAPAKPQF